MLQEAFQREVSGTVPKENKTEKLTLPGWRNSWRAKSCFGPIYRDIVLKLIKCCLITDSVWSRLPACRGGELRATQALPKKTHRNSPINNGVRRWLDAGTRWARALKSTGGLASVLIRPGFQPVSSGLLTARRERGQRREERGWPAGRGSSRISPQRWLPFSKSTKGEEPAPQHKTGHWLLLLHLTPGDVHRGADEREGLCQLWLQTLATRKQ